MNSGKSVPGKVMVNALERGIRCLIEVAKNNSVAP